MSSTLPNQLMQKIVIERKRRGLTLSVLARQSRLRQEYLVDLEQKTDKGDFTLPELRQIEKLAKFLKIDFDINQWMSFCKSQKNNQNLDLEIVKDPKKESFFKPFVIFTVSNFNILILSLITISVLVLVGLPAYLVVRPAEIFWNDGISNDTIVIQDALRRVSGSTARAKSMTFGTQEVLLRNGLFSMDLPKPDQAVVVPLVLTNYFNLVTEYQIVIKPS